MNKCIMKWWNRGLKIVIFKKLPNKNTFFKIF